MCLVSDKNFDPKTVWIMFWFRGYFNFKWDWDVGLDGKNI